MNHVLFITIANEAAISMHPKAESALTEAEKLILHFQDEDLKLPLKIRSGKSIFVAGFVHKHCKDFQVNLMNGEEYALHISPRFNENVRLISYVILVTDFVLHAIIS